MIDATKELIDALRRIASIENKYNCGDWDEITEAREIAKKAIAKHEAEFEFPQHDADGWIPWNGIRQVPPWMTPLDTVIIKSRNGAVDGPHLPRNLYWKHRGCKFDIIAYRIVTT